MRLFLAVDLPLPVKRDLDKQLNDIKKEYPQFNWVSCENYHITIHFYGETDKLSPIEKRLKDALYDQKGLRLYSNNVDLFINKKITIYLNFIREKNLEQLYKKVKQKFIFDSGHEKRFVPHLTLARCRIPSKQQYFVLKKKLSHLKINIDFPVTKVTLFESILTEKKPTYKKLKQIPLLK